LGPRMAAALGVGRGLWLEQELERASAVEWAQLLVEGLVQLLVEGMAVWLVAQLGVEWERGSGQVKAAALALGWEQSKACRCRSSSTRRTLPHLHLRLPPRSNTCQDRQCRTLKWSKRSHSSRWLPILTQQRKGNRRINAGWCRWRCCCGKWWQPLPCALGLKTSTACRPKGCQQSCQPLGCSPPQWPRRQ